MKIPDMPIFHFDVLNRVSRLADKHGKPCPGSLEAIALAKAALRQLAEETSTEGVPWIENSNARGEYIATVHLHETRH